MRVEYKKGDTIERRSDIVRLKKPTILSCNGSLIKFTEWVFTLPTCFCNIRATEDTVAEYYFLDMDDKPVSAYDDTGESVIISMGGTCSESNRYMSNESFVVCNTIIQDARLCVEKGCKCISLLLKT